MIQRVRKRDMFQASLLRLERAARTEAEFYNVVDFYDRLDENRERKERYWEHLRTEDLLEWESGDETTVIREPIVHDTVIPQPIAHVWWRQLMRGNFLDAIFDCPYDLHELTSSAPVHDLVKALRDNQKEVLYYWAIRQWSPQRIAALRGQTDRNILKVYSTMIASLRKKLYERLAPRYAYGLPLAFAQREFMKSYINERKVNEKRGLTGKGSK